MKAGTVIRRRSAYADRLLEFRDFVFSDGAEFQRRGGWQDYFRHRIGPSFDGRIIFEIGCFDAALLTRVASKFATTAFIGVDWKCRALYTGAGQVTVAGLRNVALLHGRAQDVRRVFDDGELDEVWLFHPDPCDKPKELPNRLVAEPFLLDVHRVLRDEGLFVLKTDHAGYYQWVLNLLGLPEPEHFKAARGPSRAVLAGLRIRPTDLMCPDQVPTPSQAIMERFEVVTSSADFWSDNVVRSQATGRCFSGESTGFESRFIKKRLPIYYLEMRRRLV